MVISTRPVRPLPGSSPTSCCRVATGATPTRSTPLLAAFAAERPVLTTFGNHDSLVLLEAWRNRDGTPVLIGQGEVREVDGLRVAAIGGIWAKSHRLPHYVTDSDVADLAARIARSAPIDILLTHGCPIGLGDLTPKGNHGGQRCFLEANKTIAPRFHLCGHLHVAQERSLKDGRQALNVAQRPRGPWSSSNATAADSGHGSNGSAEPGGTGMRFESLAHDRFQKPLDLPSSWCRGDPSKPEHEPQDLIDLVHDLLRDAAEATAKAIFRHRADLLCHDRTRLGQPPVRGRDQNMAWQPPDRARHGNHDHQAPGTTVQRVVGDDQGRSSTRLLAPTVGSKSTSQTSPRAGLPTALLLLIRLSLGRESVGDGSFPHRIL